MELKEQRPGILGVIADIVKVEKQYETAIETALGGTIQNIVTDNENTAKDLIAYLKQNRFGRATFLPLSAIQVRNTLEGEPCMKEKGVIGAASDLVRVSFEYEKLAKYLLGRILVVDNIDNALAIARKYRHSLRIVTLEGEQLNPGGSMTGGAFKNSSNLLGRRREIEELKAKLEELNSEIKKLEKEKEGHSVKIADTIEESARLEKNLQEIEITYATKKQELDMIDSQITKLEEKMAKLKNQVEEIDEEKKKLEVSKEGTKQVIANLEKEMQELNAEITQFAELNKDDQTYIDNLNTDITDLKISVSSFDESGTSLDEMIARIEQDIQNANASIETKKADIENAKLETTKNEEAISNFEQEIEKIKSEVTNSSEKIEALKNEKTEKNEELEKIEAQIESQYSVLNGLKEQIVKVESKKTKQEQDIDDLINRLWQEYELTPNNADGYAKPDNVQVAQKRTTELRKNIADLGSINVDAIEGYKKMQERYDFMNEQRLDLEDSITKLRNVISEMTTTMRKQFDEKFKQINKNFNEVFIELFGGGKAELILEDEANILECGIDIRVQPPGKKLQNMMLLSGGEKALTAIAILFAILKINPAPFCILDEIEAALDDVNVARYALYLKKFSTETQFLVITHRKGTMEIADTVYGVTMEEKGISKLLSMQLK